MAKKEFKVPSSLGNAILIFLAVLFGFLFQASMQDIKTNPYNYQEYVTMILGLEGFFVWTILLYGWMERWEDNKRKKEIKEIVKQVLEKKDHKEK